MPEDQKDLKLDRLRLEGLVANKYELFVHNLVRQDRDLAEQLVSDIQRELDVVKLQERASDR